MKFYYQLEIDTEGNNWSNIIKQIKDKYNSPNTLNIQSPEKTSRQDKHKEL